MIERMRMDESATPRGQESAAGWPEESAADRMAAGWPEEAPGLGTSWAAGPAVEAEPAVKRRGRWYWIRWSSGMVAIGLVAGVVLVLMMKLVNGPVSAGATPDSLEAARASAAPTPATNILNGKSVALSYPSVFDTVSNKSDDPSAKGDQYYISSKSSQARGLVVTAFGLASRQLNDDSSYKFRTIHPELYAASTIKRGAEQIVVMTKKDHTEVTAFWVHGDRDLNIALTSTDPKDNLTEFMDTIIPSIRWKQ
jgi:hypothetical protein